MTNATLHNQDEIDRKDVWVGDTVVVRRAGEVIPEIVRVLLEYRPSGAQPFRIPDRCPVCDAPAVRKAGEAVSRCTGSLRLPGAARSGHLALRLAACPRHPGIGR